MLYVALLKKISTSVLLLAFVLYGVPLTAGAQLSSSNFQIDSYVVGEGTAAQATSSNFTGDFGVSNFTHGTATVATSTPTTTSSGGSSSGTRVTRSDDADEEESATTTADTEDEAASEDTPTVSEEEIVQAPPVPYVQPVPETYVEPPTTITEVTTGDTILFTPKYTTAQEASDDQSFTNFYTVLANGDEVYVQLQAGSFLVPNGYDGDEPYQVYINIAARTLGAEQQPDESYRSVLVGDAVYVITAIDSLGKVLTSFAEPIGITINTNDTLDYSLGTKGYFFNTSLDAWVQAAGVRFTADSIDFAIKQPVLFGAWHSEQSARVLYIDTGPVVEETVTVVHTCLQFFSICWYWYVVPILVLTIARLVYRVVF